VPQILVRQKNPKANIYLGITTITLRNVIPTITVYDDIYIPPPVPYVDGGLYNQEGDIADAGFYNTTSWQIVWDGESI
jgi:hypothetical protein